MLNDHFKFPVLHIHVQQYTLPYTNCLIGLLKVLLLIYWSWLNRDCIGVDYQNIKTCAKRFLSTFGRNVITQWPFKYFVWIFPQLCENILPTTSYRLTKGTITKSLDIDTIRRCCGFFGTPCIIYMLQNLRARTKLNLNSIQNSFE